MGSKVIRVGGKFAKEIEDLRQEYSKSLGYNVKTTTLTNKMTDRLHEEGLFNFWRRDAKRKKRVKR